MDDSPYSLIPDILTAENIFLSIGQKDILKGVTIRAEKGKITGLLGRNGSGKSTMMQSIFGTRKADECDIFINGVMVKQPYCVNGLVNYLPQQNFLPQDMSLKRIARDFKITPLDILEYFPEIEENMNKKIGELSGGIERLFSVMILLLADTRFTFLDEPFSHIMPLHVAQIQKLLLQQKQKKGIIITDHLYKALLPISDYLFLMKDGKTIFIKDRNDLVLHGYINQYQE